MKKYYFIMMSCIGMSVFTSYSMDMVACVWAVNQKQREGMLSHMTDLQKKADEALVTLNQGGGGQAYEIWKQASEALWEAQLKEAQKYRENIALFYKKNSNSSIK